MWWSKPVPADLPPMVDEPNQADIDRQSAELLREALKKRNEEKAKTNDD